jgi:DNA-binding CsgD family transcriptional regulator
MPETVFPRKVLSTHNDPEELIDLGFTQDEITKMFNGECVRGHIVERLPKWMEDLARGMAIDELIAEQGRLSLKEVGNVLGISEMHVANILLRVYKKMRAKPRFIRALREIVAMQNRGPINLTIRTIIEID